MLYTPKKASIPVKEDIQTPDILKTLLNKNEKSQKRTQTTVKEKL
jgi:hypothetical protein